MARRHRVAIIVAPAFGVELRAIAREGHVWALRVPEYERVAQEQWSTARGHDLESGITLFRGAGRDPETELVEIIATVEEHHGPYSRSPSLGEIEVIGARPTAEVRAELSQYGFNDVSRSQSSFTARRDV